MRISDWSSDVCSSDLQDAPAGARLGHDGLGRAVQEVPHASHAQTAVPVSDDQSDSDGERALRLLGDRSFDNAAGCRSCLSRGGRGHGLSGLAQAQLLRAVKEGAMRLLILGAVGLVAAASMTALLAQTVDGIDVQAIKKRSADLQADAEAFVDQIKDRGDAFREEAVTVRDSGMENLRRVAATDQIGRAHVGT